MDSLFKKATESVTDLTKLQEMLGPLGGNPADAKVDVLFYWKKLYLQNLIGYIFILLLSWRTPTLFPDLFGIIYFL